MKAFVPGIYPRSEALVQATRDLDRGRTTREAVEEQVERDLAELVSAQQATGLDLLADGMLRWQDHFRPLLEAAEGLEEAQAELDKVERGESDADRWQLEQRIRHAENQLTVV